MLDVNEEKSVNLTKLQTNFDFIQNRRNGTNSLTDSAWRYIFSEFRGKRPSHSHWQFRHQRCHYRTRHRAESNRWQESSVPFARVLKCAAARRVRLRVKSFLKMKATSRAARRGILFTAWSKLRRRRCIYSSWINGASSLGTPPLRLRPSPFRPPPGSLSCSLSLLLSRLCWHTDEHARDPPVQSFSLPDAPSSFSRSDAFLLTHTHTSASSRALLAGLMQIFSYTSRRYGLRAARWAND